MRQSRRVTLEDTGTTIEYIRGRRVLRVGASGQAGTDEVPLASLLHQLGIDVAELAPERQYLLFAGPHAAAAGGAGDMVATFGSEIEARARFRQLRIDGPTRHGWAELAALDRAGRLHLLCWFGERGGTVFPHRSRPTLVRRRRKLRSIGRAQPGFRAS